MNDKLHECKEHKKIYVPNEFDTWDLPIYPIDIKIYVNEELTWMYVAGEYEVLITYCPYCGKQLKGLKT